MKRSRAVRGALLSAAVLLLTACGGGSSDGGSDGGVTTVTVWDRAGALATSRQEFFARWNETQGRELGITVSYEPQATERYEELVPGLPDAAGAGHLPRPERPDGDVRGGGLGAAAG